MKKCLSAFCLMLMLCMMLTAHGFADEQRADALTDWSLKINLPEGVSAVLQGSEYYIYARQEGSIPYVMVRTYGYEDAAAFLDVFTDFMKTQYADLQVTAEPTEKIIGDKTCIEIDYAYLVSGYAVRDRRIVIAVGGQTHMFASKEIEELDLTIGSMLEDIVADCEFLSENGTSQGSGLEQGYLYCQENGMPRYWLDMTGIGENRLGLHCWLRSGDSAFREDCLILDLSTAETTAAGLIIHQVHDSQGADLSDQFKNLTIQFYLDGAVMIMERNGKAPESDLENPIQTGTYAMRPVGVSGDSDGNGAHFRSISDGPYQPEEIAVWARFYYFRNTGIFPDRVEVTPNPDGTFTVRLYETLDTDGSQSTAVLAQYTVDAQGEGMDDLKAEKVSLMR